MKVVHLSDGMVVVETEKGLARIGRWNATAGTIAVIAPSPNSGQPGMVTGNEYAIRVGRDTYDAFDAETLVRACWEHGQICGNNAPPLVSADAVAKHDVRYRDNRFQTFIESRCDNDTVQALGAFVAASNGIDVVGGILKTSGGIDADAEQELTANLVEWIGLAWRAGRVKAFDGIDGAIDKKGLNHPAVDNIIRAEFADVVDMERG